MTEGVYLVRGMYRSRRLLDLAHEVNRCQNCGSYQLEGCEPAHSNLGEHGKGKGLKAHDCFFAALCHKCHVWLDQGKGKDPSGIFDGTREGKREMFFRAMCATWLWLWKAGRLAVL